jgi:glutathione S-transferase
MPSYKVIYFNATGRAETMRMIFKVAGVEFEDVRLEREQFTPELKAGLPFGQLPVLEVDGVKLGQSAACARYLARKFNLAGKTEWEQAQVDMVADCFDDTGKPFMAIFLEKDETRKAEMKKKFADEQLPASLTLLEKLLTSNHGGDKFFVGDELTWADIQFLSLVQWMTIFGGVENPLANYPKLAALKKRVESVPKIAEWIEQRPKTAM